MDWKLASDLILLGVATVLGGVGWEIRRLVARVEKIAEHTADIVTTQQHNELAKSLREALNVHTTDIAIIRDRMERAK